MFHRPSCGWNPDAGDGRYPDELSSCEGETVPSELHDALPSPAWAYKNACDGDSFTQFEDLYQTTGREVKTLSIEHLARQLWSGGGALDKSPKNPRWAGCSFSLPNRTNASANPSRLLIFDVDQGQSLEEVQAKVKPFSHLIHTTHSHTEDNPSFRLVLLADKPVKLSKPQYEALAKRLKLKADTGSMGAEHVYLLPPSGAQFKINKALLFPSNQIPEIITPSESLLKFQEKRRNKQSGSCDGEKGFELWTVRNRLPNSFPNEGQTKWIPYFRCIAENFGKNEAVSWACGSWKSEAQREADIKALSSSRSAGRRVGLGSIMKEAYPLREARNAAYRVFLNTHI